MQGRGYIIAGARRPYPGPWVAPTWIRNPATGLWTNAPVGGADLLTNGNMETGSPPSSWAAYASYTLASEAEERTGGAGSKCLSMTRPVAGGAAGGARQQVTLAANIWVVASAYLRNVDAATGVRLILTTDADSTYSGGAYITGTFWTQQKITALSTVNPFVRMAVVTGADGQSARADDVALQAFTLTDLIAIRNFGRQVAIKSAATIPLGMQGGVVARYSDANNFLIAFFNRGPGTPQCVLFKIVGGTITTPIATNTAYSAGASPEIRFPAANTAQLFYNNAQVGADQDVSDMPAGTWAGLFSTDSSITLGEPVIT